MEIVFILVGLAVLLCSAIIAAAVYLYRLDKKYENIPGPPNER